MCSASPHWSQLQSPEAQEFVLWVAKLDSCFLCDLQAVGGTSMPAMAACVAGWLSDCFPNGLTASLAVYSVQSAPWTHTHAHAHAS